MAGFGSALKNAILFTVFSIPGLFVSIYLFIFGMNFLMYSYIVSGNFQIGVSQAFIFFFLSLLSAFILIGIPFFKFFSDTVEDGMIEF